MEAEAMSTRRKGLSLRLKLNLGILSIIGLIFVGFNTFSVLSNSQQRLAEALTTNETMARLMAGPLLGELVDHDLKSARIQTFLNNFLSAALTLNSQNKELAFAMVVTPDNQVVAGRAKPDLVQFLGGASRKTEADTLDAIAKANGKLGSNMSVRRFELKVGQKGSVGRLLVGTSLARLRAETFRGLVINFAVGIIALAILMAYSSRALASMVVQPITALVDAMRNVQSGNLRADKAEVNLQRGDEIGVLADTYNYMVRGLRERERLKDAFNRYVSRQVYEKFQSGEIALSGEARQATVLFSDIRSFTTLSEQLTPTEVVAMLNEYFDVMVDIVFKYDGLLNKFIGDALMAIYNVPLDQTTPELRAVRTAVEMMQALDKLNAAREARGQFPIHIGIGINTGPVIAGNIGHEKRLEYTVIGDAVNLAQRLESQTKVAGATILVSQQTYQAVAPWVDAKELEPVKVKGKAEPVYLYSILGIKTAAPAAVDAPAATPARAAAN